MREEKVRADEEEKKLSMEEKSDRNIVKAEY
jgi:hypothetical protein